LQVGGFKHFIFSILYGIILPIDYDFSEGLKPPTRWYVSRPRIGFTEVYIIRLR